jgi:hypothetical protein
MATLIRKIAKYPTRIPQIYGTLVTVALILYFFIVYASGFIYVTELRVFNLLIQVAGIYLALKQYRRTHEGSLNYLRAMSIGVGTSFIASSTFVLFLFAYLNLDQNMMNVIRENAPLGEYLDPYIASFSVWLEGIFSGFLATFIIVNYIHTDNVNTNKTEENSPH